MCVGREADFMPAIARVLACDADFQIIWSDGFGPCVRRARQREGADWMAGLRDAKTTSFLFSDGAKDTGSLANGFGADLIREICRFGAWAG